MSTVEVSLKHRTRHVVHFWEQVMLIILGAGSGSGSLAFNLVSDGNAEWGD